MYVYVYVIIHTHLYLSLENYEFTLATPVPISTAVSILVFSPSIFALHLCDSEKRGFHYPWLFPYMINQPLFCCPCSLLFHVGALLSPLGSHYLVLGFSPVHPALPTLLKLQYTIPGHSQYLWVDTTLLTNSDFSHANQPFPLGGCPLSPPLA